MAEKKYKKYFCIDEVVKCLGKYLPGFDKKKFKEAYKFTEEAHRGQKRKNGDPYIVHPIEVIKILAQMHADFDVILAAIMHDVPEDTERTIEDIHKLFGKKVAFLVDGVTKLSKVQYRHDMHERQIESLKKMFLHSSKDPRVTIIKLADRLHNMRTLKFIDKREKQLRIARETLEIYVPIANLMGIQELKSELEDLCFRYIHPEEYDVIAKKVHVHSAKRKKLVKSLIEAMQNDFKRNGIKAKIQHREKNLFSIYKKIKSDKRDFSSIEDRIALRVIVEDVPQCYQVLGLVHGKYTPKIKRFKDYIANPKVNGYQSLHTTVFGPEGISTEVQIRTHKMHMEAEYGIAIHFFDRNQGKMASDKRSWWMKKVLELEGNGDEEQFLENLKVDLFEDRILAFTPKGESVNLPKGATALDFAYAIHSEVGDHAKQAVINGIFVPITTILKARDVVNIETADSSSPELFWLSFVKTNTAKSAIQAQLKKLSKKNKIKTGSEMLQKQFDAAGMGVISKINFKKLRRRLKDSKNWDFEKIDDIFMSIGEGNLKPLDVIKMVKKEGKEKKELTFYMRILAKNRFGLMKDIANVFYKYSSRMNSFKGWASHKYKDAEFITQVTVDDLEKIQKISSELNQIKDVKYVYRLSYKGTMFTYLLSAFVVALWIGHPFLLQLVANSEVVQKEPLLSNFMINIGLMVLLFLVVYLNSLLKRYFPIVRKKATVFIMGFVVPVIALLTLAVEIYYFDLKISWLALVFEIGMVYAYLGLSIKNFRKYF